MSQENKYEKLPNSMYPKVRQQVVDRIATFEKVIEDHETAQKEALKMITSEFCKIIPRYAPPSSPICNDMSLII